MNKEGKDFFELCIKYSFSCKRCPRNEKCEKELEKEKKKC